MHYSLFIPNAVGADPKKLNGVGLGHLLRDGDLGPLMQEMPDHGPSNGPGLLFVWPGQQAEYRPGELNWQPAKADKEKGLAAGRFWWGYKVDAPPTPDDIVRRNVRKEPNTLPGRFISIADQTWKVPNILMLPHKFILDDDGEEQREVCASHADIYNRGTWAYEHLKAQVEEVGRAPGPEMRRYVIEMLSLNYRLFRELAYELGLLTDSNWFSLACATVDLETLMQIEEEVAKKKREALAIEPT